MLIKIFVIAQLAAISLASHAALNCSANGTQIYYINGVNVTQEEFYGRNSDGIADAKLKPTYLKINDNISAYKNSLDQKVNVPVVIGLYNYSEGLFNDIEKLKTQLLLNYFPISSQSSDEYYRAMLRKELNIPLNVKTPNEIKNYLINGGKLSESMIKSLMYVFNKKDKKDYPAGSFSNTTMYKALKEYNSNLANLVANAVSDRRVRETIKKELKEKVLVENQKVIFVSHSQGNEQVRSAYYELLNELSAHNEEKMQLEKYFGGLQVASPSPELYKSANRHIKLDNDLVISKSYVLTRAPADNGPIPPNYAFDLASSKNSFFGIRWIPILGDLIEYAWDFNSGIFFHAMDKVYLNENIYAKPLDGSSETKPMTTIFKENLIQVAEGFDDNCNLPVIKLTSTEAVEDSEGIMQISGFASLARQISLQAKDVAISSDPKVALAAGYDQAKTTFKWSIDRFDPDYIELPDPGESMDLQTGMIAEDFVGNSQMLNVPYNNLIYTVSITATNQFNKSFTLTKKFQIKGNKPPVISLISKSCELTPEYASSIYNTYKISIVDDSFFYEPSNGYKLISTGSMKHLPGQSTYDVQFTDVGGLTSTLSIPNGCPSESQPTVKAGVARCLPGSDYCFGMSVTSYDEYGRVAEGGADALHGHELDFPEGENKVVVYSRQVYDYLGEILFPQQRYIFDCGCKASN